MGAGDCRHSIRTSTNGFSFVSGYANTSNEVSIDGFQAKGVFKRSPSSGDASRVIITLWAEAWKNGESTLVSTSVFETWASIPSSGHYQFEKSLPVGDKWVEIGTSTSSWDVYNDFMGRDVHWTATDTYNAHIAAYATDDNSSDGSVVLEGKVYIKKITQQTADGSVFPETSENFGPEFFSITFTEITY